MAVYQMSDKQIRVELMSSVIVSISMTPQRLGSVLMFIAVRCLLYILRCTVNARGSGKKIYLI